MKYDPFDRQSRWVFPSKTTPGLADQADYEQYGYDPNGNRTSLRKRDGSVLAYDYDALNRVSAKIVPERSGLTAAQTRDVYYLYDNRGLQTKARFDGIHGEGVTTYYDGFGRPVTTLLIMGGFERYLWHYYDSGGNVAQLTHHDGAAFAYSYDTLGRMTTLLDRASLAHIDDYVVRYFYNAQGGRYAAVRGADPAGFSTLNYYDPVQRPWIAYNILPAAGADMSVTLAYNPANQIIERTVSNDAYAAPAAYNVARAYSVNGLNQYVEAGPASFQYDPNGNLISDGTTGYVYDVENRLVSSSAGASLLHDPLGRLVRTSGGAAGTTWFHYDGDKLIAEYDGGGALTRRYVHGPGIDEPVAVYDGAALGIAGRRYTLADERGSIAALVHASGVPSVVNRYDSWGIPGGGNGGRFGYTGQAWIPELGMYYYKARIYSPTLGRFLQTDPVGYEDDVNLYAYVGNDPMNWSDDSGTGKVKWFVETVTGTYKRVSERIARTHAGRGGNVDAVGSDAERQARRMGKQVYGPVTRHSPHPTTPATGKGHHQNHVQPRVRAKGQTGHIFHRGVTSVIATAMASTLQSIGDGIGTAQDNVGPDSSPLERFGAQAWDFISPASDLADGFRAAAELVRPKTEERKEPCVYYKRCEQR